MFKKILILTFSFLTSIANTEARFQTIDDTAIVEEFLNRDIKINQDGTYEYIVETEFSIIKEQARGYISKFPIEYYGDISNIEIIEAKTILNNKVYPVEDSMIEDKLVDTKTNGFDDLRRLSISFPKPEIGARIYLKYRAKVNKVALDNQFFDELYFGVSGYLKQSKVTINSAIDLRMKVNDPDGSLLVKMDELKDKPGYFRNAQVELMKPITTLVINEPYSSSLNPKLYTYFSVSSLENFEQMGNLSAKSYLEIQNQNMPKLFLEVFKLAAKESDFLSRVNKITTELNQKIQYFGQWRSLNGKLIPQDLDLVANTQLGDCKDFATITTKILRELGYRANVALVSRGEGQIEQEDNLPSLKQFNHAIVRLTDENDRVYWIDPTNFASMADGIFPDIAGKNALVLDEANSKYEKIPEINPEHASIKSEKIIDKDSIINLSVSFDGEAALELTGAEFYISQKSIEDFLYTRFISDSIEESNKLERDIPKLNTRVVAPIKFSLKYKRPNLFLKSNFGKVYVLNTESKTIENILSVDPNKTVQDLFIGHPKILEYKTLMKDMKISNLDSLNFSINTPFISFYRRCYTEGEDSIIEETIKIHRSWIERDEFKSESFTKLQSILRDNKKSALVFDGNI